MGYINIWRAGLARNQQFTWELAVPLHGKGGKAELRLQPLLRASTCRRTAAMRQAPALQGGQGPGLQVRLGTPTRCPRSDEGGVGCSGCHPPIPVCRPGPRSPSQAQLPSPRGQNSQRGTQSGAGGCGGNQEVCLLKDTHGLGIARLYFPFLTQGMKRKGRMEAGMGMGALPAQKSPRGSRSQQERGERMRCPAAAQMLLPRT